MGAVWGGEESGIWGKNPGYRGHVEGCLYVLRHCEILCLNLSRCCEKRGPQSKRHITMYESQIGRLGFRITNISLMLTLTEPKILDWVAYQGY